MPSQFVSPIKELHDRLEEALARGDQEAVDAINAERKRRSECVTAVREAIDRELRMDPGATSYGFSADGAARVMAAYEEALEGG